ncbi:acyltransferase family protein [Clostridium cellulovorans]|uniref:Acyltransferase 3 n=1 Tax=Clostridium cellulovorans (strain ATCC 35296 / DSM 3052 / OCM 3 / 743B) TaxID=573061 RepID=D9SLS7_CLOC7|nr:acyltransferase [Clostridium cellulovorans]ADL53714.1 acyltransferase 3 [Clostridium cellulovorans 743B]
MKLSSSSSFTLNLIRVVAAELVLIGHGLNFFNVLDILKPPHFPYMQNIAVILFFILSGFLISYSIFNKSNNKQYFFKDYFIERFSRIYSALVPSIFLIIIIDLFNKYLFTGYIHNNSFNVKTFIGNLFMLQNYPVLNGLSNIFIIDFFGSGRPLWTLQIEWWLYLWFGYLIIVCFFKRTKTKNKLIHIAFIILFSPIPIKNILPIHGTSLTLVWLMGVSIYLLTNINFIKNLSKSRSLILLLIFAFSSSFRIMLTKSAYDTLFAISISSALLFLLNICQQTTVEVPNKFKSIVQFMANYSFTLYLTHHSILYLLANLKNKISPSVLLIFSFIFCNLLAAFFASFTEMQHKKLANKLKSICNRVGSRSHSIYPS